MHRLREEIGDVVGGADGRATLALGVGGGAWGGAKGVCRAGLARVLSLAVARPPKRRGSCATRWSRSLAAQVTHAVSHVAPGTCFNCARVSGAAREREAREEAGATGDH